MFEKPIDLITISCPDNLNLRKDVIIEDTDSNEEIRKIKVRILTLFIHLKVKFQSISSVTLIFQVVFIMARVHPGETPSSFVVQGGYSNLF